MLKITDAVHNILLEDEEALYSLSKGFLNLSGYASYIQGSVEKATKKKVRVQTIVVCLSRLQKKFGPSHPMIVDVKINSINTKAPVTELVYSKSDWSVEKVGTITKGIRATADDFLNVAISTSEIGVICSDRILSEVKRHFKQKPRIEVGGLAILSVAIDPSEYTQSNVTYSLIRRIAKKHIVLAETLSVYSEIIFAFDQKDLPQMVQLFSE